MKLFSLLKAVLTQDMNLFKYKTSANSSKFKKIMLPVILFLVLGFSIGIYAYDIAAVLSKINLTYIMLTIFFASVTVFTFMEGVYKSQSILFDSKDNDLLFSLPIKKGYILFVRLFKLLLFEYLYNLMFILPAVVIYIYFESPGINFYLITLLMTLLLPIIPTIVSCILGYIIKLVSSKVKFKKLFQTIFTCILFILLVVVSSLSNDFIVKLASNAKSINDFLTKLYYPIGAYISLINKFDIQILIKLLLINIIPLILFVLLGAKLYFKLISDFKNSSIKRSKKKIVIKCSTKLKALTKKEIKRYFSSTIYIINTFIGIAVIVLFTCLTLIKGNILDLFKDNNGNITISLSMLYYTVVYFALSFTSITSSSISIEGKTINITKTLPVDYKVIFNSKILMCLIIEMPLVIISELIFCIRFNMGIIYLLQIILLSILLVLFNAVIGLLVNLKFPKLNANNDAEIVKQSMSATISIFIGFIMFLLGTFCISYLNEFINESLTFTIHIALLFIICVVIYKILIKKGPKQYQKLNI